jgi:hypothetical protein
MSILSFPRINFSGELSTNPCTCNNDDVEPAFVQRDSDTFGANVAGLDDDQIFDYARQPVTMSNPGGKQRTYIKSGWNLYGDYTTTFENTKVTSIVATPGYPVTSPTMDPLIGVPVALLGSVSSDPERRGDAMLCDLDPTGLVTTQLWIGGLQFGPATYAGKAGDMSFMPQFNADTRGFQNWLNFMSTVSQNPYGGEQNFVGIGTVMQFAIPASGLPPSLEFPSSGLESLLLAARQAAGIVVRFRLFEIEPQLVADDMEKIFAQGQAVANPAVGYLIGTIGVWENGEPESETAGRKLIAPSPRPVMLYTDPQGNNQASVAKAPLPWQGPPALVGNAVALVQPTVISLDLVNSFPKYNFRNPNGPQPGSQGFNAPTTKANLGEVELAVIPATGGNPITIGPIDYGLGTYANYSDFGGIVDVPYDPQMAPTIATGTLVVQGSAGSLNGGTPLLAEKPIRVVTDDRAVYWLPNSTNSVGLKVYDRGGATTADTTIYLHEYYNVIQPQADAVRPNQTVQQDTRGLLQVPTQITIPAGQGFTDWFPVQLTAVGTGATIVAFQTEPTPFGQGNANNITGVPCWSFATYSSVRIFTDDDFSHLYQNPPLKWNDVYENVLRFYYLVYAAMSTFIPLNQEDAIVSHGAMIQQRLNTPDQPGFWNTYNMPVTRTMSPAKIKLLLAFIAQEMQAAAETP